MKKQRIDGQETRKCLLEAASMVFSEKGFWETTNAEICKKANANTASINYHFGSKEELYVEAWKYSFAKSQERHPPDGGVSPEAPVQERLHGRVLSFMQRFTDPKTYELHITHKEMACPTGLLQGILHYSIESLHDGFRSIVAELLGKDASERDVTFCYLNVMDMCFGVVRHLHRGKVLKKKRISMNIFSEKDVEAFADHIVRFSLAGIRSIREEKRKNKTRARSKI